MLLLLVVVVLTHRISSVWSHIVDWTWLMKDSPLLRQ